MIATPFLTSIAALLLCFLSTMFGSPGGAFINLPPDYNTFGWVARGLGAAVAIIAIILLVNMHNQVHKGTFASFLGKACMVISISCVVWEIALIMGVLLFVVLAVYGLLTS